jgi:hypothetical protein
MRDTIQKTAQIDRTAKKGDLCAYRIHRSYTAVHGTTERWATWRLGIVHKASRAGMVRDVMQSGHDTVLHVTDAQGRALHPVGMWAVAPRDEVDMDALIADTDLWGQDFDDLASVKAAIAKYRIHK